MAAGTPERLHHYQNVFMDSARWDQFQPRDDDIIICTSYKSGTTWTQMICALLIFQAPKLPRPLGEISPWYDLRVSPLEEVLSNYESQTHRRFIKTHTALDGLPYFENVTYLFCGRDPRDSFISMQNHSKNQRIPHLMGKLVEQGIDVPPPPDLPSDINERFELWLSKPAFPWEQDGFPYWSIFGHAKTFWDYRNIDNLHFLHFSDLKCDLEGQMRRLATLLDIEVDEALWPELVKAATFDDMKRNADTVAPDTDHQAWNDNAAFFHKGENEQWRSILSGENLARYEAVKQARVDPDLSDWLERGFIESGVDYL